MTKNSLAATLVGIFMLIGMACLWFLAINLGSWNFSNEEEYELYVEFDNATGIKTGTRVEIAGVPVGRVQSISLNENYEARVTLSINKQYPIDEESSVAIRTKGIIGEKFIRITPGGADELYQEGSEIIDATGVIDIEELIGKFIYNK